MIKYLGRRLVGAVVVLAISSVVVFSLLLLAPGDPASVLAGPDASLAQVEAIRHELGLDLSPVQQYLNWVGGLLTGDLGTSYTYRQPIASLIAVRLPSTIQLTVFAALLMVVLGLLLGVAMSSGPRIVQRIADVITTIFLALPPFVSGIILIFVFAVALHALPSGGEAPLFTETASSIRRLIMPAIALAVPVAPVLAQLIATEMARMRDQEFVQTVIAKGAEPRRITWRHVVPNSIRPAIVEMGIRIGYLLGGAVVVESIFTRNGLGILLVQSVERRDYPLSQILLLMAIAAAILCQLVSELVIGRLDPRVRLGGQA